MSFAFIRVSDGLDSPDEQFAENWAGAQAVVCCAAPISLFGRAKMR